MDIDHEYLLEADDEIHTLTIHGAGSRILPEEEYRLLFMLVTDTISSLKQSLQTSGINV